MSLGDRLYKYCVLVSERFAQPRVRFVALTIYYLGILVGLIALYAQGDFSTPPFIYQNF
jgi:D-Ala-teichoic acid biosynthesis protein